jgi:hypothetical protein
VRAKALLSKFGASESAGCSSDDFGSRNSQAIVLNGTAQHFAINFNGVSLPTGASLDIRVEDTEE